MNQNPVYRAAVIKWSGEDTISQVICDELRGLGHCAVEISPILQDFSDFDVIFSYGPYGNFLTVPSKLTYLPADRRPVFVHWNTEGLPNLKIPWPLMRMIGAWRSWLGRLGTSPSRTGQWLANTLPISWLNARMYRFLYLGDYHFAYHQGWLDIFADSSVIYGKLHSNHGLPTIFVPWGATPRWYADLGLERDIDVLWMGNREGRRHRLLNRMSQELRAHGINFYVADGIERPFVHGEARTEILNRAKITLNLTRTTYDDNFSRFSMAAPNRSLIISEPLLPHCPIYEPGVHYISAPVEQLTETILHYLKNETERLRIVGQAYQLVTTRLTFRNSMRRIVEAVDNVWQTTRSKRATAADDKAVPGSVYSLGGAGSID